MSRTNGNKSFERHTLDAVLPYNTTINLMQRKSFELLDTLKLKFFLAMGQLALCPEKSFVACSLTKIASTGFDILCVKRLSCVLPSGWRATP